MSNMEQDETSITLPIEWRVPEDAPTPYATHLFTQAGEYDILLSFFQVKPPLLTGTPEENKTKLEQLGGIKAACVNQVLVPADLVPKIIQALQTTWDAYMAAKKREDREE